MCKGGRAKALIITSGPTSAKWRFFVFPRSLFLLKLRLPRAVIRFGGARVQQQGRSPTRKKKEKKGGGEGATSHRDTKPDVVNENNGEHARTLFFTILFSLSHARFTHNLTNSGKFQKLGKDTSRGGETRNRGLLSITGTVFFPPVGNMVIYVRGQLHQVTRSWPGRVTVDTRHSNHDKLTWPEQPLQSQREESSPFASRIDRRLVSAARINPSLHRKELFPFLNLPLLLRSRSAFASKKFSSRKIRIRD